MDGWEGGRKEIWRAVFLLWGLLSGLGKPVHLLTDSSVSPVGTVPDKMHSNLFLVQKAHRVDDGCSDVYTDRIE